MATKLIFDPPFRRGETLHMEVNFVDDTNNPIVLDGTYTVKSMASRKDGGPELVNLNPVIADGKVKLDYPTTDLIEGSWFFDIQITLPSGELLYTETYQLPVDEPQSKPPVTP